LEAGVESDLLALTEQVLSLARQALSSPLGGNVLVMLVSVLLTAAVTTAPARALQRELSAREIAAKLQIQQMQQDHNLERQQHDQMHQRALEGVKADLTRRWQMKLEKQKAEMQRETLMLLEQLKAELSAENKKAEEQRVLCARLYTLADRTRALVRDVAQSKSYTDDTFDALLTVAGELVEHFYVAAPYLDTAVAYPMMHSYKREVAEVISLAREARRFAGQGKHRMADATAGTIGGRFEALDRQFSTVRPLLTVVHPPDALAS
jgi:hypothetical protein